MTAASIQVRGITRIFRLGSEDVHALKGIDLDVKPQEFVALIGRSGSGKTTLMNIMAGLDKPTSGEVIIDGRKIHELSEGALTKIRRKEFGFIFQSFGLLPLLSAQENVELPLRIAGFGHGDRVKMARSALDLVGLSRRSHHRPYELSGGEQQRVAIARALATRPRIILADEPTGELDSATARIVFDLLRQLARDQDITVVTCTHDRLVMDLADRVEELADGRLVPPHEGELWKQVQETARSPFDLGRDESAAVSSLVGADLSSFGREQREREEAERRIAAAAGEPDPLPDEPLVEEEPSQWARPRK